MVEEIGRRPRGMSGAALRTWAAMFLLIGIAGKTVIERGELGIDSASAQALMEAMDSSSGMGFATIALICRLIYCSAVPIYAFLLTEGFQHTSDFWKYLERVLIVACAAELPYNLALSGNILNMSSRNPCFALALGLVLLFFYRQFAGKCFKNVLIKAALFLLALVWVAMLRIDEGFPLILLVTVFYALREKQSVRGIAACSAALVCSLSSIYYIVSPMTIIMTHFYNGEEGESGRAANMLCWPLILLVFGVLTAVMF